MNRVASLHCYPVKSCRGIDLQAGFVERRGFRHDRRFMIVDENGLFRAQRKNPELARVEVSLNEGELRLSVERSGAVAVPLDSVEAGPRIETTVWKHTGLAVDQGDEAAAFLEAVIGAPSRLAYMPEDVRRPINPDVAQSDDDIVGFHDGYPFLVTNTASLAALQELMDEEVPMGRFRPNIVIDGAEPWAEDHWQSLWIGTTECYVAKACTRCVITTTDQRTGERFREPLRTLAKERKTPDGVTFGVYVVPRTVGARIAVGDPVAVVD